VDDSYQKFYSKHANDLGHYFRALYHLIKFVDESDFVDKSDIEGRRRYTSIARAQLSIHELGLLFYNGVSSYGDKFKPLIEKYGLLEPFDHDLLFMKVAPDEHINFYAERARK